MIEGRTLLLVVGCAMLASVIAIELRGDRVAAIPMIKPAAHVDPVAAAAPPLRPSAEKLIAAALDRPLFSPTRRPPAKGDPASGDLSNARLTGIVVLPEQRLAIFAVTGAKPVVLSEGGVVNGWQVETITAHDVLLRGPTGISTLQPKMDPGFAAQQQSLAPALVTPAPRPATAVVGTSNATPAPHAPRRGMARTGHDQ